MNKNRSFSPRIIFVNKEVAKILMQYLLCIYPIKVGFCGNLRLHKSMFDTYLMLADTEYNDEQELEESETELSVTAEKVQTKYLFTSITRYEGTMFLKRTYTGYCRDFLKQAFGSRQYPSRSLRQAFSGYSDDLAAGKVKNFVDRLRSTMNQFRSFQENNRIKLCNCC